jgi:SAM-dependent methyltransferase
MRQINLRLLMRSLYSDMKYYVSIPAEGNNDFEENYHQTTIDPDGKSRNLLEEREHHLAGVNEIVSFLENSKPGKILDIGCGLGWILSTLGDEWDKHGVEISKFASNHAKQFATIHNGSLDNYECSGFDIIVMNHVIEHLKDPILTLTKIHNILNNSGIFICGTPDFDSAAARRYGSDFRLLHDPTHISLFSCDSMHRCLRDHCFNIFNVEYPYFDTPWFNKEDLLRILNPNGISPPFYGSSMTFFCKKKCVD